MTGVIFIFKEAIINLIQIRICMSNEFVFLLNFISVSVCTAFQDISLKGEILANKPACFIIKKQSENTEVFPYQRDMWDIRFVRYLTKQVKLFIIFDICSKLIKTIFIYITLTSLQKSRKHNYFLKRQKESIGSSEILEDIIRIKTAKTIQ